MKKVALFACLFLTGLLRLVAQPITVSVTIVPPYDPDLFVYTNDETRVLITVTNTSAAQQSVKLGGTFRSLDDRISVATDPNYQPPQPLILAPGETSMLNSSDLGNLFPSESSIITTGITREEVIRTRRLPRNTYQLCITAYEYNSTGHTMPLSTTIPGGCSSPFTVGLLNAPEMISFGTARCNEVVTPSETQNFIIQWTIPPEAPAMMRYVLEMIELYPIDRNPYDAFESATTPIFFTDSVLNVNSYTYTLANPVLEAGRKYAIRVRAVDPSGSLRFANRGYSPPCTFFYGSGSGGRFTLESAYPTNGDYVPWRYAPVMVKFSPYDNQLYRFNYTCNISQNGVPLTPRTDELRWPWGPAESQTRATGMTITEEAARFIPVNEPNATASGQFVRGAHYTYTVNGSFLHRSTGDRNPITASCNDEFIAGMGVPVHQEPADHSNQDPGTISFRFNTAELPTNLLPSFAIVTSGGSRGPTSYFYNQGISERYVLEVSRVSSFSSVLQHISRKFAPGVDFISCVTNQRLLHDSVYRSISHSMELRDTGMYYWRVKWVQDDNDENSLAYVISPTWSFHIGARGPEYEEDHPRTTPPSCLADCSAAAVTDRTGVSTAANGTVVRVGKFSMTVTEIHWSGTSASGRGHIRVPFMNAPVKVTFSSIQINAGNELISGDIFTETDNSSLVPDAIARATGTFTGLGATGGEELNQWLTTSNRLVSQLAGSDPVGMPLGIDNTIDGQRVTIGILGCKFTATMATLNAEFSVDIPELHGWLSLGANDICFHPGGLNMGQGKLYLPMDHDLVYTDDIQLILKSPSLPRDSGTYVSWDCAGFKELSISGVVRFGRNMLVPDANDGTAGPGQVEGRFKIKVQRMGNWVCALDMDRFQVAGLPEWGFEASEAYLDFSDLQNAGSMEFPEGYGGERTIRWKGFYLKRLAVRLPHEFRTYSNPTQRITGSINNVLIDGTGFSARFALENLVSVTDGNLDGWGFSLDTVYLSMVSNDFRNAGLNGEIQLPISDRDALEYDASLNRSSAGAFSFEFRIHPKDTFEAQIWETTLRLLPTSSVSVIVDGEGFAASTDLSGSLSITGSRGQEGSGGGMRLDGISLQGIRFEHFRLNSRGPEYISVYSINDMVCARASEQHSSGGFPLSISGVAITNRSGPSFMEFDQSPGPRFGLEFSVDLNLTGESSTFHASTKIAFLGKLNISGERQDWTFTGINLDSIAIGGSVGAVELEGSLVFYNSNPTFGKGIRGFIHATFNPTISVSATVQFGEVNGFRYWYVDAMATWSPGVTLFTGVDLRGIGGGAWYHMRKPSPVSFSSIVSSGRPASNNAGTSSTGSSYVPDGTLGLGFEARIKIGAQGGSSAYHGLITLGAEFEEATSGIRRIFLTGDFIFMTESDDRLRASASADFDVEYNFATETFQANFAVYVNVADVLVGVNPRNLAGQMEILVSPQTWHIYVGQPDVPVGLRLQLGSTRIAEARFYLMVGEDLPPMPPLPARIAEILNVTIERDVTNLERGDGFAMGTSLNIGPLNIEVMPFYASMELGFGFDLSVKKYTTRCEGMAPTETMGANGWYARGQIYGYFTGSMGLFVDLFFVKGRFEIFSVQAAAYLQGGFPNPNWVEGMIAGDYNILNGAITGHCSFSFSQGQKCVPPVENPMAGMEIVASLSPENLSTNVDCGVEPNALYNYSLDREFSLTTADMNGRPIVRTFRVREKNTKLTYRNLTSPVGGNLYNSENNTLITFSPDSFLSPRTAHFWTTTGYAEEYKNGSWATSRDLSDRPVEKKYTSLFITGPRPDRIRVQDVAYSYPFHNQRFFLQNECRLGVLALKRSMGFLFERSSSVSYVWQFKARFTPNDGGDPVYVDLRDFNSANIHFDIPQLQPSKVYQVDFVAMRTETTAGRLARALSEIKPRYPTIRNAMNVRAFGNSTIVTKNATAAAGSKTSEDFVLLYTFYFKTSQYNDITSKFAGLRKSTVSKVAWGDLESLTQNFTGEGFDEFDINSHTYNQLGRNVTVYPLVSFNSVWDARSNAWMERQGYYTYNFRTWMLEQHFERRDFRTYRYGTPPHGPVYFSSDYSGVPLLADYEINPTPPVSASTGTYSFRVPPAVARAVAGSSRTPLGGISIEPQIPIFYGTTTQTLLNRGESRNWARTLLSYYGYEFLTAEQMAYLTKVANDPYNRLSPGNYTVNVLYNPPTCGYPPDYNFSTQFDIVLTNR